MNKNQKYIYKGLATAGLSFYIENSMKNICSNDNKRQQNRISIISILLVILCLGTYSCKSPESLVYQDVKNFRLMSLSLTPDIGMDIQFYNPNNFNLNLKDANIDVYINNVIIGKAALTNTFNVPSADTFLMPVKITADLAGIFANAYSILSNKAVDVRLQGNVKAGKGIYVNVPINYQGKQKLNVAGF